MSEVNNIVTRNRFAVLSTEKKNHISVKILNRLRDENAKLKAENDRLKRNTYSCRKTTVKEYQKIKELRAALEIEKNNVLYTEEKIIKNMERIRNIEIDALTERFNFLKLLKKRVFQIDEDLIVNLFGGFPRRFLQRRSTTNVEHKRFMKKFYESDLDMRIYFSKSINSDLAHVLTELHGYGLNFKVDDLREIVEKTDQELPDYGEYVSTMHAKCTFIYKNKEIKADIFNRYYINFSSQDYTCNQIEITKDGISLNKERKNLYADKNRDFGMEALETMLDFQKMETKPLFKEAISINRASIHHMKKMMKRQKKMMSEGYRTTRTVISNDEDADQCPICYESYDEDSGNDEYIPPKRYPFALCGCTFGLSICSCCFKKWPTMCPQCKLPWKICMTKEEEPEADFVLPEIIRINLRGNNLQENNLQGNNLQGIYDSDDFSADDFSADDFSADDDQ